MPGLSRRLLAATVAVAAAAVVLGAMPALAEPLPIPVSPATATAATPLPVSADALAARAAVAAKHDVVLIAHTATAKQVSAASTAVAADGLRVTHRFTSLKALSVQVAKTDVVDAKAALLDVPGVQSVEQSSYRYASSVPVDPDYATEQAAYYDAVDAPAAWTLQQGSPTVRIAIIDTGVDVNNPDLAGKFGADDLYNAVTKQTTAASVDDTVGHGTFVAGVAAADTDNDLGGAGAGYNTQLMAIKVASGSGTNSVMSTTDEVAGIQWAVAHGANIINISLGGADDTSLEQDAIEQAIAAGVVVVAAAGNDATTIKSYPAAYPGVIAVGATDGSDRASFSNYGSWVTVAAPGVNLYSTIPTTASSDFVDTEGDYATGSGTSFSSPLVAGEAALLKAQNPSATGAEIRAAIVASAHGFAGKQLGTGQVDFAGALADLSPATKPTAVGASGSTGVIGLQASSTAAKVQFAVDGVAIGTPVAVSGGTAALRWSSWGSKNGTHVVSAADCSSTSACDPAASASRATSASFTVANAAPTVSVPSRVTGRFTITASTAGGALRFLIDGRTAAFVRATSPMRYSLSASSLKNGSHRVRVVQCAASGSPCAGPSSATVAFASKALHPTMGRASNRSFSPNGDRVKDTTTLTWTLPDTEFVRLAFVRPDGTTARTVTLGTQRAGRHSWVWTGTIAGGRRAANGTYLARLLTSKTVDGAVVLGAVDTTVSVDTRRPALTRVTAGGSTFYPYKDGYRDSFAPTVASSQPAALTLTVRSSTKQTVRAISKHVAAAHPATIGWNGRTAAGARVPAGTYTWRFTALDAAGTVGASPWRTVHVSNRRIVHTTATIVTAGHADANVSGSDPTCDTVVKSRYAHGVHLRNACSSTEDGTEIALAEYRVTLPKAVAYGTITASVHGYVTDASADLAAVYARTDTTGYALPAVAYVTSNGTHTVSLGVQKAAHVVSSSRRVKIGVALGNDFVDVNSNGLEDFDIATLTLRVTYTVLR